MKINTKLLVFFASLFGYLFVTSALADQTLTLFPLTNYDQNVNHWIKSDDPNYDKALLNSDIQQKRLEIFYNQYFGASSPWNPQYINEILQQKKPNDLKTIELSIIENYSNENKPEEQIGYGAGFRPHSLAWIKKIINNISLSQFDSLSYQPEQRAIAINNLNARALPTTDVHFYNHKLAGQGYPFDNLQMSAIWAGTPLYILLTTRDHAWSLVVTPDYIGWVKSNSIARTSFAFINQWTSAAKKHLAAITHTRTSILNENGKFLFLAYVGSVFPAEEKNNKIKLMIPRANENQDAIIDYANVSSQHAALMPFEATPHHFAKIMRTLVGRTYGWGNMYFYNDCSAELKSLFTPFGIWLPRHSSHQVSAGTLVDMSASSEEQRISYLTHNGRPLLTIIYIGGHIILYIGNYQSNSNNQSLIPMTYQNVWGLSPNPPNRRAVIGKAVFFPILVQYPEDPSLISLANKKYFQVSYLDNLPKDFLTPQPVDLRLLMYSTLL